MEELQTTEILDREILEDARKKAYRILKTADETVKTKAGEWEKKISATVDDLRQKYEEQRALAAAEIMARLPMDKRRAKAEKIESLFRQAVDAWYAGLGREQVLAILKQELTERLAECEEFSAGTEGPRALVHKLDRSEAESVLKAALGGKACGIEEASSAALYPELILENSRVRITASIQKTVDFFLHEKRAELATALLGESAVDGGLALGGEAAC
jgi:vacuolar-type H+-ATPase subunit E/Vma4